MIKKKETKNNFPLYVLYKEEVEVISDTLGEDGRWSGFREESKDYSITGVSTVQPQSYYYEQVVLHTDNELPNHVYVVLVRYSDGGTFCHTSGNGHIEGVYDSFEEADAVAESIKNNKYKGYCPWDGHFNRLEGVSVETEKVVNYKIVSKKY